MCSQGCEAASCFPLFLMLVICGKYFTHDYLNDAWEPGSDRGESWLAQHQAATLALPVQVDAVRWVSVGTALPWVGSVWPGQGSGCLWWSSCPGTQLLLALRRLAGRREEGCLVFAWARHITSFLLSQRLNYSRGCFQIISTKFPPCNNRNLI